MYKDSHVMLLHAAAGEIMQTKPRLTISVIVKTHFTSICKALTECEIIIHKAGIMDPVAKILSFEATPLNVADRVAELYNITDEL